MTSVSATELAKLGKCEAMITPRKAARKPARRKKAPGVIGFSANKKNQAAIDRGDAAHDRFEREAQLFTSQDCNHRTILPNLVLALAVAACLLTLKAAVAT